MVRPVRAAIACALVLVAAGALRFAAGAAGADKALAPFKGTVGYQAAADAPFNRIFGRTVVPDDAYAVTQSASLGTLTLPDSSQVAIGERTAVKIGAFNTATSGADNVLTVNHGALRFAIVHPAGTRANYSFRTQTSQIAVRGTIGYLIVGDEGTQLICVECAPGDVDITIGQRVVSLVSGFTITIIGPPGAATFIITPNSTSYNPSIAQFLLLLLHPDAAFPNGGSGGGSDPTGYLITGGHSSSGLLLPIVAEAAAIGVIVSNTGSHSNPPPTPTPVATPTPSVTPIPFSTLTVSTNILSFNVVGGPPQTFSVAQSGPSGSITIGAPVCNGDGAAATDSPGSVPITAAGTPATISVNAVAAPTASPAPTHACQITITGGNGQTAVVNVDITSTQVGVHAAHRGVGESASPAPSTSPVPHPVAPANGHPPH